MARNYLKSRTSATRTPPIREFDARAEAVKRLGKIRDLEEISTREEEGKGRERKRDFSEWVSIGLRILP